MNTVCLKRVCIGLAAGGHEQTAFGKLEAEALLAAAAVAVRASERARNEEKGKEEEEEEDKFSFRFDSFSCSSFVVCLFVCCDLND